MFIGISGSTKTNPFILGLNVVFIIFVRQTKQVKIKFMKNKVLFLVISAFLLMSFAVEKLFVIKFKEDQINYHWQNLQGIKQILSQSALPHNQVVFSVQAIDSLQKDIQLNLAIDSLNTSKK
jgi:hypothetical protein